MVDPSWNSVRGMLSTSLLWGRFWCSRTIQIWSKVIPYCDNSAEKIDMSNRRHGGSWVEPLPISEKDWAGTWIERPQSISLCNRCVFVGWRHLKHTPSPCIYGMKNLLEQQQTHKTNRRKFYICADGPHTHTLRHTLLTARRSVFFVSLLKMHENALCRSKKLWKTESET